MGHEHHHFHGEPADVPAVLDLSVPDGELSADEVSRRRFLRGAGLLGAGAAAGNVDGDRPRSGGTTLGGTVVVRRGATVELTIDIDLATRPNWAQFVPKLKRVDVIAGPVTGPAADWDVFAAPGTTVVKSFEVGTATGTAAGRVSFTYRFPRVDGPFYVRVRGTDGNRTAAGFHGAATDPAGPAMDVVGNADPWNDLRFYANPIWVLPR